MSVNWSGVRTGGDGILRSGSSSAAKEELLVFGYSCKLFRDDDRAREVDQGRLLIPWAGDETLRIDRYDVRGALHELSSLEAPPGGHDWRLELTDAERRVEQLCDEERYRALYCDEEEELMYKEEELKRLRAVGYGQIGFNYDAEKSGAPPPPAEPQEVDEPFVPTPQMQALLTPDVALPDTQKLNAIIEKTATFIARQGAQMEILLRAKQAGNAQFNFLDKDSSLHRYYRIVLDAVRHNKLAPHKEENEVKPDENEDYLHPSLAAPVIESAPSIPSIHYKPSADCDYTMLISRIKGDREEEPPEPAVPAGELAPPGTQPLVLPGATGPDYVYAYYDPTAHAQIARGPVLYAAQAAGEQQQQVPYSYPTEQPPPAAPAVVSAAPGSDPASPAPPQAHKSTGLNLMHYYNSGSESEHSESEEESTSAQTEVAERTPPADIQLIINKMAAYVARNGDEFQDIVKAKNDPRFTFLYESHEYHPYYKRLMLQLRGVPDQAAAPGLTDGREGSTDTSKRDDKKKSILPVSFSIKKLKEPESILPKPALPYESSEDEKDEKETAVEEGERPPESHQEAQEPAKAEEAPTQVQKPPETQCEVKQFVQPVEKATSKKSDERKRDKSDRKHKKDKRKKENGESKKRKRDKSVSRDKRQRGRSCERRERSRSRERSEGGRGAEGRGTKDRSSEAREREEVITIEDELIDLTGDISDGRGETDGASDKMKQSERKRRAAAFLAAVGRDATSVAPPAVIEDNTLASAMVKTLVELHAKKEAAEERKRRREKQKRRHKRREEEMELERERERSHRKSKRRKHKTSSEEDDEYYESSSKHRKRKKEKKRSSSSKSKKKHKRSRDSSRESTPPQSRRHSESPRRADDKEEPIKEENGTKKSEFDPAVIKNKLKMLREELDDDEVRRWRAESQEIEKEKKEYSEGELESSEDKSSSDSGSTVTE